MWPPLITWGEGTGVAGIVLPEVGFWEVAETCSLTSTAV